MCGIAGFFATHNVSAATAEAMMSALGKRGPDAQQSVRWNADWSRASDTVRDTAGDTVGAPSALIHARLSIIDPRPISDQPMQNDDGSVWICYNGEVYDWAEHAETLKAAGTQFKTRSDTEFILHAYQHWGIDMISRLRGMFAIAILDLRIKKLWLIRDRMGLKPMVYSCIDGNLAFGSTVRSVLPFVPANARQWDRYAIDAYLAHRYVPAPRTIFENIQRLPNAHWLSLDLTTRRLETKCYWTPPAALAEQPIPDEQWLATLDAAVSMRTVADRPLGVFLSSGIDSSTVASRLALTGHSALQTFTAGFDKPEMDESPTAAKIAAVLGFPNQVIAVPGSVRDDIDQIIEDLDEPFADPSAMPSWYLARETTKHVKVVLGGDGGDELFAGYKRFDKHLKTSWRRSIFGGDNSVPRNRDIAGGGVSKFFDEVRLDWWRAYSLRFSGFTPSQRAALQPALAGKSPVYWRGMEQSTAQSTAQKWLETANPRGPVSELLEIDRLNYLPEYILRKGDLCTMAHGLELRAPLLDHTWVSLVQSMPASQRFTQPAKQLLRVAMPQLAASDIDLFNAKKKGFNPPLDTWLKIDLADRLDDMPANLERLTDGQIRGNAAKQLLIYYRRGKSRYAEQIFQLLVLEMSLTQLDRLRGALP
jgi:asparagine synthase (glutamine-hydrolysing)